MLLNLDQLEKQLEKEELQEIGSMDTFRVRKTQFQMFINSRSSFVDDDGPMIRKVNKRLMQTQGGKVVLSKAVDVDLVVMESSRTGSGKQDTSSSSGSYLTHVVDADIRLVNDQVSLAEKLNTPRSCLRWKPTGRIFKIADLRWIPTGKMYTDNTTKVDSEPPNGLTPQRKERCTLQCALSLKEEKSYYLREILSTNSISSHARSVNKWINITLLKEVNSRAKVQSPESINIIKLAKRIPNVNKPERWISIGYRFSPNKSSTVHKKLNTPRSCLRWKPTGRIFKIADLRWIPTGKMYTDNTTKVDSEPPNGSNDDITNPYECDKTLNDLFFQPMFNEYFKPPQNVDHPVLKVPTPVPAAPTSLPSLTTVDQDAPSTSTLQTTSEQQSSVIPKGVEDDFYDIEVAYMDNDPYFGILIPEPVMKKQLYKWSFH
nr:hypothetical protein [Tanacetum cinerariifolium]